MGRQVGRVRDGSRMTLIIDCDPGIDDLVALALAARSPESRLAAVTTTYGNAALAHTTRNARHLLTLAGRTDVPVVPGAARPLDREPPPVSALHGPRGSGYAEVPNTERRAEPIASSPLALRDVVARAAPPVTLVTLGPLTNLAHAVRADLATLRRVIRRHLAMAGSVTVPRVDFNARADPEALDLVLAADLPTELVPLDVTSSLRLTAREIARQGASSDPLGSWLGAAVRFYAEAQTKARGETRTALHDPVVVAEAIAPGLLDFAPRHLKIALGDSPEAGRVTVDQSGRSVRVATRVEAEAVRGLLDRAFGAGWRRTGNGGAQ